MFGKNTINTIVEDLKGILWVGTTNGLYCFNTKTGAFTYFLHDARNPKSLSANEIRRIYVDRSGTIWIGTLGAGINRFNYEQKKFDHFSHDPHRMNSINSNYVRAIFKDSSGILWIGTRKGLNRLTTDKTKGFDSTLNKFQHFKYDPKDPDSLSHNEVWCIYEDRFKNLWIGTRNGGLNKFNRTTEKFTHYLHDPENPNSLSRMGILSIYEDRSGILWLGAYSYAGGLYNFDRSTGKFNRYEHNPDDPNSISHNEVWCIFEDRSGTLWIGTGNGLNKFNREKAKFSRYQYITDKTKHIHINRVFCIYEDKAGILWIGTDWGLYKFNRLSGKFTAFFEKDGLPNNRILGILSDNDGNLWLSTNRGISKFNTKTKIFKNFDVNDGLQSKEFNPGAYFKSSDGKMFFGGVNGFSSFYPENIKDNPHIPQIVITDFKIFDKSVKPEKESPLHKSITESDEITLSYRDYVFSFDFVALDYISPEKNKYAYKLEGFDKNWIYTDASKRFAHYSNLSPGKYIFRVIGSNNDGIWNRKGTSIKITIVPPFWKTLWFKLIVLFLFCMIIYGFLRFKTDQMRYRAKILENSVNERTKELQSSEEKYRTMIEYSNDMIWTLDEKGSFLYFNKKSEEITGYKLKDWYGKSFTPLILGEDLKIIKNIFIKTMKGVPQHYELSIYDHKRNLLTLSVNTAPILKEGKVIGTVSFGRDITEKRKMEEELFKASKLESIGILAGGIAHDFNNILAGIIGNISMTKLRLNPEDKIFSDLIKIEKASLQAKDLTNQLLTFAKGGAPVKKVTLIKDLIKNFVQFALTGSSIRCKFSIYDDLWPVEIDENQIGQVINNLIINAGQAMQAGGVIKVIAENIYIDSEKVLPLNEGRYVKLSIKDAGSGISKEHLDKIFDPYFTTKEKGSGLGLSITYSIIKKHNGCITVESEIGTGTTFHIYLPALEKVVLAGEKKKERELILGNGRILLMDDERIVRDVLGTMLRHIGYEVDFAEDGDKTIELYRKAKESGSPFDVVILDLTIPGGMGGEKVIKKLIKIDPVVKAIVSSGYSDDPVMSSFRKYGFSGVLLKPYIIQDLSEVLHRVMYEEKK
jgi:PAS domain S-box-containing protein